MMGQGTTPRSGGGIIRIIVAVWVVSIVFSATAFATERTRTSPEIVAAPKTGLTPLTIHIPSTMSPMNAVAIPGDTCTAWDGGEPWWLVRGWLIGQETYQSYQDPELVCSGAYPFSIEAVHFILLIDSIKSALTIPVQVEILSVDSSTPGCPKAGTPLYTSAPVNIQLPGPNFYDVTLTLDQPYVVDGPYFVSFTFLDSIWQKWYLQLVTDNFEAPCRIYNQWDSAVGFIDLGDDHTVRQNAYPSTNCCYNGPPDPGNCQGCFDFDGRVMLYTSGKTGGYGGDPIPRVTILSPVANEKQFKPTDFWIVDGALSPIIDSAVFYYALFTGGIPGSKVRIGVDADGAAPIRRVSSAVIPNGYSVTWNNGAVAEGSYRLYAELYDSLGRKDIDSVNVVVEPTPPVPTLVTPSYFVAACDTVGYEYTYPDEAVSQMRIYRKPASLNHTKSLETLKQFTLGDADGNSGDGNPASAGEFGDYYSGPASAAVALRYWYGKGYVNCMKEGATTLTKEEAAERVSEFMQTRITLGTRDDWFVHGFRQYLNSRPTAELKLDVDRAPTYQSLRANIEELGQVCVLGLGDPDASWIVIDGARGHKLYGDSYGLTISDPFDGLLKQVLWRDGINGPEITYRGGWRPVQIAAYLSPAGLGPTGRVQIKFFVPSGGTAAFTLDTVGMTRDSLYFIIGQLFDASGGHIGYNTHMFDFQCAWVMGDYNGDFTAGIGDVTYLIEYQFAGGQPAVGGATRFDGNCDSSVNLADIIFYMNWVFLGGAPPCY